MVGWLILLHWRTIQPNDDGTCVRVQHGVIGGLVNARLKAYGAAKSVPILVDQFSNDRWHAVE